MKGFIRGFTLIELLVVIAIIGVLASIVLVSLNGARKKGSDARVISDVQGMRTAIESGFNGLAYADLSGGANADCNANANQITGASFSNCTNAGGFDYNNMNALNNDAHTQNSAIYISTNGLTNAAVNAYSIRGQLVSNTAVYFCLDSTGHSNPAETVVGASNALTCY